MDDFLNKAQRIIKSKNGLKVLQIFNVSVFFAPDSIDIWMFHKVISNRVELENGIRTLDVYGYVSYSEENYSFTVPNEARNLHRDFLNKIEMEDKALNGAILVLRTAKPSYHLHYRSVYLHAKQYPHLFKNLGTLPGKMLKGMIDEKQESIAVDHGKEWVEFLTNTLGEYHWTVLHLRARLGLGFLELGSRDTAVDILVDVYKKTCQAFGDMEVCDILSILAKVILKVDDTNKKSAENHLRELAFCGETVSDSKDYTELENWVYYANLIAKSGLIAESLSILDDIIKCIRRLFGPKDDRICDVMQYKALVLKWDSRYQEALKVLKAVNRRRKNLDVSDPKILKNMFIKGDIFKLQGKLEEALNMYEQVIERSETAVSGDQVRKIMLNAKAEMMDIRMLQKNYDEALRISSGVQNELTSAYGVVHPVCFFFRKTLASVFWEKFMGSKAFRAYKDLVEDFENSYEHEMELKSLRLRIKTIEAGLFTAEPPSVHYKVKTGNLKELVRTVRTSNVRELDCLGQTALHYAAAFGRLEEARVLLEYGSPYDHLSRKGYQPIDLARKGGEVHMLLTVVHSFFEAVKDNNCNVVPVLASKEPCLLWATDTNGDTALLVTIKLGHKHMLKTLSVIDIGRTSIFTKNPMMTAAKYGQVEIAEMLLQMLGRVALDPQKNSLLPTPLHVAAERGHLAMVRFLLSRGAVYCSKNREGQMARQVAKDPAIKDLLRFVEGLFEDIESGKVKRLVARMEAMREEEKQAVAGACNDRYRTLLDVALDLGDEEILKEVVQRIFTD